MQPAADRDLLVERGVLTKKWPLACDIEVHGKRLYYGPGIAPKSAKLSKQFLPEFLAIADATVDDLPKMVGRYASCYGVLELCERHDLPSSHPNYIDARHPLAQLGEYFGYCPPRRHEEFGDRFWEPISGWRYWSRQALALVNAAGNAKREELGPEKDLTLLLPMLPRQAREIQRGLELPNLTSEMKAKLMARIAAVWGDALPHSLGEQWKIVAQTINYWLNLGRPQPICTIERFRPVVTLAPGLEHGWLFTMLSIQLLVAVTGAKAIECCTNCRSFYTPKKLASTGRRRFCPKCGIRAARRFAQADFRNRHG